VSCAPGSKPGVEQERQTQDAIRQAGESLERRDLQNGMQALESVRQSYGDSPRVASAIAEFKTRRVQIANELLTAALASATEAIQQGDRERATGALNAVADAAEFADAGLQANLKKLAKEAQKAAPMEQVHRQDASVPQAAEAAQWQPVAAPVKARSSAKSGFPWVVVIVVLVVVLVGGAGAGYWFFLRPRRPCQQALSNSTQRRLRGRQHQFRTRQSHNPPARRSWTPLRLDDVPVGKYSVTFKGTDGATQSQSCEVTQTAQVCTIELKPVDDNTMSRWSEVRNDLAARRVDDESGSVGDGNAPGSCRRKAQAAGQGPGGEG